ncbi:MAG: LysR family transcriptional regulator [Desulfarculaceae bacterium]|nr:LysR family transcriptional regulator [Desulfarculaceae bacterium]MCF8072445.1 LysR family transcriptional regulator [Desulfarculaceae bacterium]MCF8102906.1 LysR family transcriptional regulator [Desulfarculaceae bacterium]MCF8118488.1 LysR family transcriptional regulator [Desulfarculaceae bacterium]
MELPIDLLQTFSSIAETGSFTQAGEAQHITQSAVSMQMKRLEGIVGHSLFQKRGRSLNLTSTGETLLEHTLMILKAHNEAVAAFARPDMFGRIRFGCPEEYASRFLPTVLADFRKAFPRIRVDLYGAESPELNQMLIREELDLCLLGIKAEGGRVIHREPLVWATSSQGTAHAEDPVPLAVYHEGCCCRKEAMEVLRQAGKPFWIAFVSHSISSILAAVRAGLAVAPISAGSLEESFRTLGPENGFPLLSMSELSLHQSPSADKELVSCFADFIEEFFQRRN